MVYTREAAQKKNRRNNNNNEREASFLSSQLYIEAYEIIADKLTSSIILLCALISWLFQSFAPHKNGIHPIEIIKINNNFLLLSVFLLFFFEMKRLNHKSNIKYGNTYSQVLLEVTWLVSRLLPV